MRIQLQLAAIAAILAHVSMALPANAAATTGSTVTTKSVQVEQAQVKEPAPMPITRIDSGNVDNVNIKVTTGKAGSGGTDSGSVTDAGINIYNQPASFDNIQPGSTVRVNNVKDSDATFESGDAGDLVGSESGKIQGTAVIGNNGFQASQFAGALSGNNVEGAKLNVKTGNGVLFGASGDVVNSGITLNDQLVAPNTNGGVAVMNVNNVKGANIEIATENGQGMGGQSGSVENVGVNVKNATQA